MSSRPVTRPGHSQPNPTTRPKPGSALGERSLPNVLSSRNAPSSDTHSKPPKQTQPTRPRPPKRSQTETSTDTLIEAVEGDSMKGRLRAWMRDSIDQNLLLSACFWGEKLVTVSKEDDPNDVYCLAYGYYLTKQYSRVVAKLSGQCEGHVPSRCLMAECLMKLEKHDEAEELLRQSVDENKLAKLKYLQGMCALNSKNMKEAKEKFQEALKIDVRCYEPFHMLINGNMLTYEEEMNFLQSLNFKQQLGENADLVQNLYFIRLKKYMKGDTLKAALQKLETTYGLGENPDLLLSQAEFEYIQCRFEKSLRLTTRILELDPLNLNCLWTHIATLHHLSKRNTLFLLAHELVDKHPAQPVSWFAVGSYYLLCDSGQKDGKTKNADARRHFSKSTKLDPGCAPAWIGFAHALAADGEHEQAVAAYSQALRFFKGTHLPSLYIGMEHIQMKNFSAAKEYLKVGSDICPFDPLVESELGTICYHNKEYEEAEKHLNNAINLSEDYAKDTPMWEITWNNLGHTCRKLGKLEKAQECFKNVLLINPDNSSAYLAMGLMDHTSGRFLNLAQALSLSPDDAFCTELLEKALEDSVKIGPILHMDDEDLEVADVEVGKGDVMEMADEGTDMESTLPMTSPLKQVGLRFSTNFNRSIATKTLKRISQDPLSGSTVPPNPEDPHYSSDEDSEIGRPIVLSRTGLLFPTDTKPTESPQKGRLLRPRAESEAGSSGSTVRGSSTAPVRPSPKKTAGRREEGRAAGNRLKRTRSEEEEEDEGEMEVD
ncbi:anaphase promoting complex subunit cdc16 [Dinochytrium kinnereticum]|nr:anaphase promoting complex subunit cdc16 [Dinochytrium kinnereticum]